MASIIGFCFLIFTIFYAVGADQLQHYAQMHSILLVFGGTIALYLFSNTTKTLKNFIEEIKSLIVIKNNFEQTKTEIILLAKNKNFKVTTSDELVNYAQNLWQSGISQEMFVVLLSQHRKDIEQKSLDTIQSLKNLSKYPAALGMIGTVVGMISLFQSLDKNKANIGASLSLAMTATFMGLILANVVIMPLADKLQIKHINEKNQLTQIYQLLLLINQNESSDLIEDEVKSRAS